MEEGGKALSAHLLTSLSHQSNAFNAFHNEIFISQ